MLRVQILILKYVDEQFPAKEKEQITIIKKFHANMNIFS